jgi:hypothetical protein
MIEVPDPGSVTEIADWVELSISIANESLSKAAVSSAIEDTIGEEPSENFIISVWRELERRQQLYSQTFFRVYDHFIEPENNHKPPEYLACLLLSLYGGQRQVNRPAKLFERLSSEAIRCYLSGQAIVFGWPFDLDDRPGEEEESRIKRKIRRIAEELRERFSEAPRAVFKDRGLDVVGWIPFLDMRSSQIVILMQSTVEHNWKDKLPVPLDAWCQYIHWGCNPVKAFAVPCIINEHEWQDISVDKGILFDRARIVNLLSDGVQDMEFKRELSNWIDQRLADLEN